MSTICRSDIRLWKGRLPNRCLGILGQEIIGVIEQLVDNIKWDMRALAPPDGVDMVIEVCGIPDVIPAGLKMLRVEGDTNSAGS